MSKQNNMPDGRARNAVGGLRQVRSDKDLHTVCHQYD